MTIASRNPVHSVLWLILAFFNAAGLFLLIGAEFLAFLLVIVYVGAVAVLFLFVVMMLDVDFAELRAGFARYWPFGFGLALVLLAEMVFARDRLERRRHRARRAAPRRPPPGSPNIEALGQLLYTRYLFIFEAAGLVLLVAMVGAIVLTRRKRSDVRPAERLRPGPPPPAGRGGQHAAAASGRGWSCDRALFEGTPIMIGFGHYLAVGAILFVLGVFGIFLNRKNVIVILMAIELILLAVNINLVAFSAFLGDMVGQVFAMFVLTVAAAEAAIGLAILVIYFRGRGTIAVDDINQMKG